MTRIACALVLFAIAPLGIPQTRAQNTCNATSSKPADIRAIAVDPSRYHGMCVSVSGILRRNLIYADVDGIYQQSIRWDDPSSNGGRLGLSGRKDQKFTDEYRAATVTGRIGDCGEIRRAAEAAAKPGHIVMVMGYCHTSDGVFLGVDHIRLGDHASPLRQLPDRARPGYGNLMPAPANWPHEAFVRGQIARFLDALKTRDADALAALHAIAPTNRAGPLLHFLLDDNASPFAQLRKSRTPLPSILLISRGFDGQDGERTEDYSATVCFCRHGACEARWPIAAFDADNLPERPYACTHVGPWIVEHGRIQPVFETSMERYGLAEPP